MLYDNDNPITQLIGVERMNWTGGMSIEDAALESGFNDPKYFARRVKKHFGCTPSKLKTYGK